MNKLINAAILIVIVLVILYFLVPLLTGIWHTIALIVVVIGGIEGLMKIAGAWF